MRSKKELQSAEFNDDMSELEAELKSCGIAYEIKKHAGALEGNGKVKELLGYYPTGEWHLIIEEKYSVIRGMASFGLYEIMNIGKGKKFIDPERFATAKELVDNL